MLTISGLKDVMTCLIRWQMKRETSCWMTSILLPLCPFKSLPCNCSPRETMGIYMPWYAVQFTACKFFYTNRSVISTDLYSYLVLPAEVLRPSYFLANCGTGQVSWMEIELDPCLDERIITYLNKPEVQKALHANTTHLPYHWDSLLLAVACFCPINFSWGFFAIQRTCVNKWITDILFFRHLVYQD